jgi:precorrin-4 C11-methyltransferase
MKDSKSIALVAVTRRGLEQARLLRRRLRSGEVHRPLRYGPPDHGWEMAFEGQLSERVSELFRCSGQLVFFLAAGAVTRLIAPCLRSKESDPGVLTVDEAGRFVIPLLSGHQGGANTFARTVAGCLGATPVITTASDVVGGLSLDLLAEAHDWTPEPRERLKAAARALVDGEAIAIVHEVGCPGDWLDDVELPANVTYTRSVPASPGDVDPLAYRLWITDRQLTDSTPNDDQRILSFRPKSLILGVGCERGISAAALDDGLEQFLRQHQFARSSIATLATVDLKADEDGLLELARRHGWQPVFYSPEELAAVSEVPNPSDVVDRCIGTPGVAEPAALLASRAQRLLVEKVVLSSKLASQRMTFAVARIAAFEEVGRIANPSHAKVVFVGAGPGDPDLLTIKGRRALSHADEVVYAGSLVPEEILRHAAPTAVLHNSAQLTLEEVIDRLGTAVRSGKRVVRLHSGDTSLYSAIQEQMTLLDAAGIAYEVIPGVSSFQAAAAALKSELTLPEVVQTVILTRAEGQTSMPEGEALADLASHRATLCVFLSARLAQHVQDQLLTAYPADTPAAIVYRVSWPDQMIVLTELSNLAEEVRRNKLTRTTLIMVGPAVGRRQNRSRLYDPNHGHIFRAKTHETHPST